MAAPLRIAFMGTPDFTVHALRALIEHPDVDLVCVYTMPPRPAGRGQQLQISPVHEAAEERGISVRTPVNFKDPKDVKEFAALDLDVAVVAGYGMILPKEILTAPKHGCINIHPSLLPRWRGVAPVQYAIWHGDKKTGVCVMKLDEKMDTGPIILRREMKIESRETALTLNGKVWPMGAEMLSNVIDGLVDDKTIHSTPQDGDGATYTRMFKKEDGKIDWSTSAIEIDRQIRALNPWPGTWCEADGKRLKILAAHPGSSVSAVMPGTVVNDQGLVACGNGTAMQLDTVQPENKKPMNAADAVRGGYLKTDAVLS